MNGERLTLERKLVVTGIGGQGIIFVTKVLAQAAMARGERVMASENHGMSQRGGSVMSYVKIGGSEAPLIRRGTADTLVALDRVEAIRALPYLRLSGQVCVNSPDGLGSEFMPRLNEMGVQVHAFDADACAKELGASPVANLVLLGFAAARGALGLTIDELQTAVQTLGPAKAVGLNLKALEMGARRALAIHETL